MNFIYILIIFVGVSATNITMYTIDGFITLQSCQKAEFKAKDQDGVYNAFCIEKEIK